MEPTDAELIAAVLAGDQSRFAELVHRHGRVLLAFLSRRVVGQEAAREMYQETWVQAFAGLATLRNPNGMRAWLLGIGVRVLAKARRLARRSEVLDIAEALECSAPAPGADLESAELRGRLERELARLPTRQRSVFELRALRELDYADVARLLEITEENARANYYQAARKLRAALERS